MHSDKPQPALYLVLVRMEQAGGALRSQFLELSLGDARGCRVAATMGGLGDLSTVIV